MKVANISIYQKIENKGLEDAKNIKLAGQKKAKLMEESLISDAQKEINKMLNASLRKSEDRIKTNATDFEQAAKQRSLLKKKEIIDNVFNLAHQKLKELNDNEFRDFTIRILKSDEIKGNEIIKVSKNDFSRYLTNFSSGKLLNGFYQLDKLNGFLGPNYQLKLSTEDAPIESGFILVGNTFDIDNSYTTILQDLKEKYEAEIAKILFEDGE